jgi:hypothetical protein
MHVRMCGAYVIQRMFMHRDRGMCMHGTSVLDFIHGLAPAHINIAIFKLSESISRAINENDHSGARVHVYTSNK